MARLDIHQLKPGEKLAYQRDDLVRDIFRLCPPDKQRRFLKPDLSGIFKGKVTQVIERLPDDAQRNLELLDLRLGVAGTVEVAEEELADCDGGFVGLEDGVCLGLFGDLGGFDLFHAADVAGKVGLEAGVDGGVVDGDEGGD